MTNTDPHWLSYARTFTGLQEVPGKTHAPQIQRWLRGMRAWWDDDETPWCGVFVDGIFRDLNLPTVKNGFRARAWLDWGTPIVKPTIGCVVVFNGGAKRPGAGHVGFIAGADARGRLMVLGGNQGNAVTVAPFERARVLGYRWPSVEPLPLQVSLPLLASNGKPSSENEA